jgi:hypothetical protein
MLLGSLLTTMLTTTATARPSQFRGGIKYEMKVVSSEAEMNAALKQGYEYANESAATGPGGFVDRKYTMRRLLLGPTSSSPSN